jgi:hypothetical protein
MEAIGYPVGGVGLFFVGLHLLSSGLRQMTGRRFRLCIAKWLGTSVKAGVVGFVAGFLSQSMSALDDLLHQFTLACPANEKTFLSSLATLACPVKFTK